MYRFYLHTYKFASLVQNKIVTLIISEWLENYLACSQKGSQHDSFRALAYGFCVHTINYAAKNVWRRLHQSECSFLLRGHADCTPTPSRHKVVRVTGYDPAASSSRNLRSSN